MKNGSFAKCVKDITSNKMWVGDIVQVLDFENKKYKGIEGHNIGEIFWCIGDIRELTDDELNSLVIDKL